MTNCINTLLLAAALSCANVAFANTQSLAAIQSAAEEFTREQFSSSELKHHVSAGELDPRLRLEACGAPLETFGLRAAVSGARMTVGVRCPKGNTWTLYVPVSIEVEAPVLVLRRALARRARVAPTDVEPQVRRLPGSAVNFITDVASLDGHRLKRALPAGAALTVEMLKPDILVQRGQQVTLIAQSLL